MPLLRFTKRRAVNASLGVAILIGVGASYSQVGAEDSTTSTSNVVEAEQGTVVSTVSSSGTVESGVSYGLSFQQSGEVTAIDVKVGDTVTAGQVLARVEDTTQQAALRSAEASLRSAEAQLRDLRAGTTAAEDDQYAKSEAQSQQSVRSAQTSLDQAKENAEANRASNQRKVDEARAAYDEAGCPSATTTTTTLGSGATPSCDDLESSLESAEEALASGERSDRQAIEKAEDSLASSQASYDSQVASNRVQQEPATTAEIAQQESSLASAREQLVSAQQNVEDTQLRAPVDGTVSAVNGKVGSQSSSTGSSSSSSSSSTGSSSSSSSTDFLTLVGGGLQVSVGFSESDATRLVGGQAVAITFDALSDVSLNGTLLAIDTTAETVDNIVTYQATVSLQDPPSSVVSGMTASVEVIVDEAIDVVYLPSSAVTLQGNSDTTTVEVQIGESAEDTETRTITVGLQGDEAVEITDGLEAGEKVVVTSTGAAGGTGGLPAVPAGGGGAGGAGLGGGFGG